MTLLQGCKCGGNGPTSNNLRTNINRLCPTLKVLNFKIIMINNLNSKSNLSFFEINNLSFIKFNKNQNNWRILSAANHLRIYLKFTTVNLGDEPSRVTNLRGNCSPDLTNPFSRNRVLQFANNHLVSSIIL